MFNLAHQSFTQSLPKSAIIAYSYRMHGLVYQKNFILTKRREIFVDFAEKLNINDQRFIKLGDKLFFFFSNFVSFSSRLLRIYKLTFQMFFSNI